MAIKIFTLLRAQPGIAADDFARFLSDDLIPRLRSTGSGTSMTAAVLNRVEVMNYREGSPTNAAGHDWSAILELYFDDAETAVAAVDDAIEPSWRNSGHIVEECASVVVNEIFMYDQLREPDPVKVFGFFRIVFDMTRRQVFDHWFGPHADLGREIKADQIIRKYFQNHTLESYHCSNPDYDYDGASVVYFSSYDDAASIYRNPDVMGTMEPDERNMGTEPAAVVSIAAREQVVFDDRKVNAAAQ